MGEVNTSGPVPIDSVFIYRPDKRLELWRFAFYMFLHAGWLHLLFNLGVQVVVGLPLEMVHGSLRIAAVYMAGVLAGSLGTSVFDTDVYLVGASGGVYALLAAHLANVLLNYNNMEFGIVRLIGIFVIASSLARKPPWLRPLLADSTSLSCSRERPRLTIGVGDGIKSARFVHQSSGIERRECIRGVSAQSENVRDPTVSERCCSISRFSLLTTAAATFGGGLRIYGRVLGD
ncbi:hypothetical protein HN011_008214 [Eciton burchellii]|nr:hypothetical protein HN011_008214 [Eciton burchellii]